MLTFHLSQRTCHVHRRNLPECLYEWFHRLLLRIGQRTNKENYSRTVLTHGNSSQSGRWTIVFSYPGNENERSTLPGTRRFCNFLDVTVISVGIHPSTSNSCANFLRSFYLTSETYKDIGSAGKFAFVWEICPYFALTGIRCWRTGY